MEFLTCGISHLPIRDGEAMTFVVIAKDPEPPEWEIGFNYINSVYYPFTLPIRGRYHDNYRISIRDEYCFLADMFLGDAALVSTALNGGMLHHGNKCGVFPIKGYVYDEIQKITTRDRRQDVDAFMGRLDEHHRDISGLWFPEFSGLDRGIRQSLLKLIDPTYFNQLKQSGGLERITSGIEEILRLEEVMRKSRRAWMPSVGLGSSNTSWEIHEEVARITIDAIKRCRPLTTD